MAWNTLTPLIVFVKKNKGTNISKVVYTQSVPFLTNRRNLIRIPKTILNDAEICFGCFVIEDIYKNYNDNRHALVFFQKIFYEDEIQ